MTHLEVENLVSDYLENQLSTALRAQVDEHLALCGECRELLAQVRHALEFCYSAEDLEPAPWMVSRILLATVGQRKPTLSDRITAVLQPIFRPQVAYAVAMAVFSFSIIVNAAGINLRGLKLQDLNPRTWIYQASRNGHLLIGRAEKYYYDLKVVYEVESRLRRLRAEPNDQDKSAPKQAPAGGSTDGTQPDYPRLASAEYQKARSGRQRAESSRLYVDADRYGALP